MSNIEMAITENQLTRLIQTDKRRYAREVVVETVDLLHVSILTRNERMKNLDAWVRRREASKIGVSHLKTNL